MIDVKYKSSPFEIARKIDSHEFVLPRFQRELDWKTDRISKLFDSIYRGFNINLVVLWEPKKNIANYGFISDYSYGMHNPEDTKEISMDKIFVLDGQQRFEALYIGLYGSYTEKNGIKKELYFYLNERGNSDSFIFISSDEYEERNLNKDFLFKVSDLRKYDRNDIINGLINDVNLIKKIADFKLTDVNLSEKERDNLLYEIECYNEKIELINNSKDSIYKLYDRLNEASIMYYMVDNNLDEDSVEELFVRMNTGGSQLSNAEIILSKLSTKWKIKARENINGLIDDINNRRKDVDGKYIFDYSINLDFVMKAILVLLDKKSVSFKLNKILNDDSLIAEMESNFDNISFAIKNAFTFVKEYGFNHNSLRSNNAVIPIAYYLYKNDIYSSNPRFFLDNRKYVCLQKSMIKWLCATIISGFWTGANDTLLILIRKTLNSYNGKVRNLDFYHQLKSNSDIAKNMKIEIGSVMKYSYNSSYTYSVLCALYLNNDKSSNYIRERYDVDHIFPKSKFNEKYFDEKNIEEKNRKFYRENFNFLPNLQLLTVRENRGDKKEKDFDIWIKETYKSDNAIRNVLDNNYIDKVYKFDQFKTMYNKRKKLLSQELLRIFD